MKYVKVALGLATGVAIGLGSAALGLAAPSAAAPAGPGNANDTISQLVSLGKQVIVDRLSDAPLSEASVVSVRPGTATRQMAWDPDQTRGGEQVVYVAVR